MKVRRIFNSPGIFGIEAGLFFLGRLEGCFVLVKRRVLPSDDRAFWAPYPVRLAQLKTTLGRNPCSHRLEISAR